MNTSDTITITIKITMTTFNTRVINFMLAKHIE